MNSVEELMAAVVKYGEECGAFCCEQADYIVHPPSDREAALKTVRSLAARMAVPLQGWQSIDSAPQNRKVIIAYRNVLNKWRRVMACYYPPDTLESEQEEDDGFAPEGWYEEAEGAQTIYRVTDGEPELWHELPAIAAAPAAPDTTKDKP